jgi:hypothetical protein
MKGVLPTKARLQRRIREWTGWTAAALLGGGVALSLSIIFLGPGIVLLAVGALVALGGWGASIFLPGLLPYRNLACPFCQRVSGVFLTSKSYQCDGCGRLLATEQALPVPELTINEPMPYIMARKMLITFTALSYVAFFIEVYLGHYIRLQLFLREFIWSHSLAPIFFSPIALVIALVTTMRLMPGAVRLFNLTMLASIVVGLVGSYFHIVLRLQEIMTRPLSMATWMGDPPALAPFAFVLPGIMGLVATYGLRWEMVAPKPVAEERPAETTASSGVTTTQD